MASSTCRGAHRWRQRSSREGSSGNRLCPGRPTAASPSFSPRSRRFVTAPRRVGDDDPSVGPYWRPEPWARPPFVSRVRFARAPFSSWAATLVGNIDGVASIDPGSHRVTPASARGTDRHSSERAFPRKSHSRFWRERCVRNGGEIHSRYEVARSRAPHVRRLRAGPRVWRLDASRRRAGTRTPDRDRHRAPIRGSQRQAARRHRPARGAPEAREDSSAAPRRFPTSAQARSRAAPATSARQAEPVA